MRRFLLVAVMAVATLGAGGCAVASSTAGPVRTAAAGSPAAFGGAWEGSYTCSQGPAGLDLKVAPPGKNGALRATFSFYPQPRNPSVPVGSFTMAGTYHSAATIVLHFVHWVLDPPGSVTASLSGQLTNGRFHGTVHSSMSACTTFSATKVTGNPTRSQVTGTWQGVYHGCTQGTTGLKLTVNATGKTGNQIQATFSFFAVPSNPSIPSGSYSMTGYYFPGGVALDQGHWIHQPPGYAMVNLVGNSPHAGTFTGAVVTCTTFSLTKS